SVFEFLSSTTPGKFILGRKSILENGEPLDATAAILRNLFRPIDILLAYPLLALTRRKQRLGDLVAETLVIKRRHNPSGNIALICLVLLLLTLGFLAKQNPNRNWVKTEWQRLKTQAFPSLNTTLSPKNTTKNLLPNSSSTPNSTNNTKVTSQKNLSFNSKTIPASTSLNMKITEFYFSAGPDPMQIRMDGQFHRGDFIFMFFKLAGFEKVNSSARITEQIQIYNPQDQLILEKPNVLEFSQTLPEGSSSILFANQITLSNPPELGTYRVVILLKDENKKDQLVVEKSFVIQ
ncbi:MAG: RDD family protein, partial [Deltaproteobacteria bacterium]|nr:RDD family protein [Deltaproteobacteria bacterium]